jgi:hypothetical protein
MQNFDRAMAVKYFDPYRKILFAASILAWSAAGTAVDAAAATTGTCLKVANVDTFDVLFIRERPDHRSEKTGAIAPDSTAPLVVTGPCTPRGAPLRKLWCPIKYYITKDASRTGYVKMYFTEEIPCPPSLEFYKK